MAQRQKLGEYLLQKGIISEAELKEALEIQRQSGKQLGLILIDNGYASEEEITKALAEQLKVEYIDLERHLSFEITKLITKDQAKKFKAIPIRKSGGILYVAMENPLDVAAIDELRVITNLNIKPMFACPGAIKTAIERAYQLRQMEPAQEKITAEEIPQDLDIILQEASGESVVKIVNRIIEKAVKLNASDIHLEPEEKMLVVRFRIDGILHNIEKLSKKQELLVISRIKIMANIDIAEKRLPQDGRIELSIFSKNIDLRVSTFPTLYGENLSIRVLDKSSGFIKLEHLGFNPEVLKSFDKVIRKPQGIILVTGPTGSGKTTTLYAVLNAISSSEKNILTLEDPIEYVIPHIRQSQINVKAGLTFANGLRAMVRQDPDIIMIGEIRDRETAEIAIHSALTGHLVLSTLHTNDASSAAMRLVDMGVEPFLVASTLNAILAQRLIRQLCSDCKKEYSLSKEEINSIKSSIPDNVQLDKSNFFKETGCQNCSSTGFKGRTAIFELLIPDEEILQLIIEKAGARQIKDSACKKGMTTLYQDGVNKVLSGVTSLSEVLRVVQEE